MRGNIIYSLLSHAQRYGLQALILLALGRTYGVEKFGAFMFLFTLAVILSLVIDFGLQIRVLIEIPRNRINIDSMVGSDIFLKIILSILLFVIFIIFVLIYDSSLLLYSGLMIASGIFLSFGNYFISILRCFDRYDLEVMTHASHYLPLCLLLVFNHYLLNGSLLGIYTSFLFSRLLMSLYGWMKVKNYLSLSALHIDRKMILSTLNSGLPYAFLLGTAALYVNIDTIIIGFVLSDEHVGLYQSVFRMMMLFMILPELVNAVFLPKLSKYFEKDKQAFKVLFYKLLSALTYTGVAFGIFFFYCGEFLLKHLFGSEYSNAVPLIGPFAFVLVMRYLGAGMGTLLLIFDRQWFRIFSLLAAVLVGVAINLLGLGRGGIIIAAYASIVSHVLLNSLYFISAIVDIKKLRCEDSDEKIQLFTG